MVWNGQAARSSACMMGCRHNTRLSAIHLIQTQPSDCMQACAILADQVGQDAGGVLVEGRLRLPDAPALLAVHVQQVQEGPAIESSVEVGKVLMRLYQASGEGWSMGGGCWKHSASLARLQPFVHQHGLALGQRLPCSLYCSTAQPPPPFPAPHLLPSGLAPLPCMSSLRSPSTSASTCALIVQ